MTNLAPVWRFAVARSREAARLAARVRTLTHDLAVVTAERDALRAHFELAVDQRNHARDLAVALADAAEWSDLDRAFLESGVWPGVSDGVCPVCFRPILDHSADERKACHDKASGYRRPA